MEDTEIPFEEYDGPTVAGSSATFQSLARVFRRGDNRQRPAARMLLLRSGVWMPVDVYRHWPVLLPWIVRDNDLAKSQGDSPDTGLDQKGTASQRNGLQRQDNTPVKDLKKNLAVRWGGGLAETFGTKPLKSGQMQWMQSHCWSGLMAHPSRSTAGHPLTNSFVPNLVWLPDAIGRLTDDERLIFKDEVRAIAWARYRHVPVAPAFTETVESAWSLLQEPQNPYVADEELALVNEFHVGAKFYQHRLNYFNRVWEAVNSLRDGQGLDGIGLTPQAYAQSLSHVSSAALSALREHLAPFACAAREFEVPASAATAANPGMATKKKSEGTAAHVYAVTTPHGTTTDLARSRAALLIVGSLVESGVEPAAIGEVLQTRFLSLRGALEGTELWTAMQASGVSGPKSNWFVNDPIHTGGATWVVNANAWTKEYAARKLPSLCQLSSRGEVSYVVVEPSMSSGL